MSVLRSACMLLLLVLVASSASPASSAPTRDGFFTDSPYATRGGRNLPAVYDPDFAARQILGRPTNVTPGGRTITDHAAKQMVNPPKGRVPMSVGEVDNVLDTATRVRKLSPHPQGTTVTVQRPDLPGRPQVVIDAETGRRVVTVIRNR